MTNEVRLIDANALKAEIQELIEHDNAEDFDKGYNIALQGVIRRIENAPTIKPELPKQVNTEFGVMEQPDELSLAFMGEIRTDK